MSLKMFKKVSKMGLKSLGVHSVFYDTMGVCNPRALFGGIGVPPPKILPKIARKLTRKARSSTLGGTIMRVASPCGSILV